MTQALDCLDAGNTDIASDCCPGFSAWRLRYIRVILGVILGVIWGIFGQQRQNHIQKAI
ncbi:MAG: hypothetical protein VKL59_02025 [Nostocaceae cyanobacterium]|nr:hypothetical protein [Nostocaceae cyanobacterium]